jgi:hypothetical protein
MGAIGSVSFFLAAATLSGVFSQWKKASTVLDLASFSMNGASALMILTWSSCDVIPIEDKWLLRRLASL